MEANLKSQESDSLRKPMLGEVHLLTDKQLADAFHILFGKDWKKHWTERDKAAEMRTIFNGGTQPCCPFTSWVKLMEFLALYSA